MCNFNIPLYYVCRIIMMQLYLDLNPSKFQSLNTGGQDDEAVFQSTSPTGLEQLINATRISEAQNLFFNARKTKIMKTAKSEQPPKIKINNETIKVVDEFQWLGIMLTHNGNIKSKIKQTNKQTTHCAINLQNLKKKHEQVWARFIQIYPNQTIKNLYIR